jgi:hypothetical protein
MKEELQQRTEGRNMEDYIRHAARSEKEGRKNFNNGREEEAWKTTSGLLHD